MRWRVAGGRRRRQRSRRARELAAAAGDELEAKHESFVFVHGPLPADRCVELIEASLARSRRPSPDALAGLGFALTMMGRVDEARARFEDALLLANEIGAEWSIVSIHMYRGAALLMMDEDVEAEAELRAAAEALRAMGERSMRSTAAALLAEALYRQGRYEEAMEASVESEGATASDDLASAMAWRGVRAKLLAKEGNLSEARRLAEEAVSIAGETDLVNMTADAHMDLAVVLRAAGDIGGAAAQTEIAAKLLEAKGNTTALARVEALRRSFLAEIPVT